jgi:hypothetical protein
VKNRSRLPQTTAPAVAPAPPAPATPAGCHPLTNADHEPTGDQAFSSRTVGTHDDPLSSPRQVGMSTVLQVGGCVPRLLYSAAVRAWLGACERLITQQAAQRPRVARLTASDVAVVGELPSLPMRNCCFAPKPAVTCDFGSQWFSSFHAVFGAHVPSMCPRQLGLPET